MAQLAKEPLHARCYDQTARSPLLIGLSQPCGDCGGRSVASGQMLHCRPPLPDKWLIEFRCLKCFGTQHVGAPEHGWLIRRILAEVGIERGPPSTDTDLGDQATATAPAGGVREVVGVFRDETALETAIDDLQECGFDRADISLLASEQAVVAKLGHAFRKVTEIEDDDSVPRVAYVSKEDVGAAEGGLIGVLVYAGAIAGAGAVLASGGALGAALLWAALAGGSGGAVGLGLARWIDKQRAQRLNAQLERGGLLLWVYARTPECEEKAMRVLRQHGAEDVHAHDLTEAIASQHGEKRPYPPLLSLLDSVVPHRSGPRAGV